MSNLNNDVKMQMVAKMLTHWRSSPHARISMEKELYSEFFTFLRPVHTVHDKKTQNIVFLLFDREDAIRQIKSHYSLKEKEDLCRTNIAM